MSFHVMLHSHTAYHNAGYSSCYKLFHVYNISDLTFSHPRSTIIFVINFSTCNNTTCNTQFYCQLTSTSASAWIQINKSKHHFQKSLIFWYKLSQVRLVGWLGFNGTFSTNRPYRAIFHRFSITIHTT